MEIMRLSNWQELDQSLLRTAWWQAEDITGVNWELLQDELEKLEDVASATVKGYREIAGDCQSSTLFGTVTLETGLLKEDSEPDDDTMNVSEGGEKVLVSTFATKSFARKVRVDGVTLTLYPMVPCNSCLDYEHLEGDCPFDTKNLSLTAGWVNVKDLVPDAKPEPAKVEPKDKAKQPQPQAQPVAGPSKPPVAKKAARKDLKKKST
ncbi:hypothetical protein MSAN_02404700 [Mycena sanguinolenta]|uniref:Uncharacterized protein n=1 Tax=Mycena sanguinolenta TaxID=230812 RepID=A0A8H6X3S1_9AGAR|nr:hypothetical protein MSAN_02404700 [Mycena sanguinolenta]